MRTADPATIGRLFAAFAESKPAPGTITAARNAEEVAELRDPECRADFAEFCAELGMHLQAGDNMSMYLVPVESSVFAPAPSSMFASVNDPAKRCLMQVIAISLLHMFYEDNVDRYITPGRDFVELADLYKRVNSRMEAFAADAELCNPLLGEGINIKTCAEVWSDMEVGSELMHAQGDSKRYVLLKRTVNALAAQGVFEWREFPAPRTIYMTDKGRDLARTVIGKERMRAIMAGLGEREPESAGQSQDDAEGTREHG